MPHHKSWFRSYGIYIVGILIIIAIAIFYPRGSEAPNEPEAPAEVAESETTPASETPESEPETVADDETEYREEDVVISPIAESTPTETENTPSDTEAFPVNFEESSEAPVAQTRPAKDTVSEYFSAYNSEDFKTACGLLSFDKCNPKSVADVSRFSDESEKLDNGYEVARLWVPESAEGFKYDVVCVEYDYRYKTSSNPDAITEIMSFYVDGDTIEARVCEQKTRGGSDLGCPILSRRDFCLD